MDENLSGAFDEEEYLEFAEQYDKETIEQREQQIREIQNEME